VVSGRAWAGLCAGVALSGALGCGAVLGLNDYGDAVEGGAEASGQPSPQEAGDDATPDVTIDAPASAVPEAQADGSPSDAGGGTSDADADAAEDADAMVVEAGPAIWTRVAFAPSVQGSCPAGFSSSPTAVVFDTTHATAGANTCTCDCSLTAPPSCVTGSVTGTYSIFGSSCGTTSQPLSNTTGGCDTAGVPTTPLPRTLSVAWNPLPATGGSCAAIPGSHPDRVTFTSHGTTCAAEADAGDAGLPSPYLDCIASPGTFPCPAGPLSVAHYVGTGAEVSCAGTCGCTVSGTCSGAQVTYYQGSACATSAGSTFVMPADGTCHALNGGNTTYGSYIYSATVQSPACSATGTPTATITGLAAGQTICCAQ
jgi:hypothetical protein